MSLGGEGIADGRPYAQHDAKISAWAARVRRMAWSDPKLWLTLGGVLISIIALWRVEVRNKNERHQQLLDRADEWLKKLYKCLATAKTLKEAIERILARHPDVDADYISLELERDLQGFVPVWDWSGPTLPAGPITEALKAGANECRLLHHELTSCVVTERWIDAAAKLKKAHDLIESERGTW